MAENKTDDNVKSYILDPLSVIIKLAIIYPTHYQTNVNNMKTD